MAEDDGLIVVITLRSPDNDMYRAIVAAQEAALARHGTLSILGIIPIFDGPLKADKQAQKEGGAAMAKYGARVLGNATAVTVGGLQGTILRLIISGIQMLQGAKGNKITATIREAVQWLQLLPGQRQSIALDVFLAQHIETLVKTSVPHPPEARP